MTDEGRFLLVDLIATKPPARPACFDTQADWTRWLVAAHEAGEKIVRRSDTGRTRGKRETHFEVLPMEQIDICRDCTEARRQRMQAAGRCSPPMALGLLAALKAGASHAALAKIIEARPIDPVMLRSFYEVVILDLKRAQQAAAAAVKNERARQHVQQAWASHLQEVAAGRAEQMSKATFSAVMVAAMAKDQRFASRGRPFSVTARQIEERWLSRTAGKADALPAKRIPTKPAEPAHQE